MKTRKILFSGIAFLSLVCSGLGYGQISLNTSPYIENFDGIGTTQPTGWSVRTGATSTALGAVATFPVTATAWNVTTGHFRNVASATGLTSTATTTAQNSSSNRSLAVRQSGTFANPGASFVLQLANTSNRANFQLSFKLNSFYCN